MIIADLNKDLNKMNSRRLHKKQISKLTEEMHREDDAVSKVILKDLQRC